MSKLQDIRELAQEHATLVSSSPRDWMGYMDTAARLYRYPFTDQLLIHAQHPQATACASLELWNEKMFRWVNRGARGIALLDENGHNTRLRYVFDISDTHMVAGGRSPYLWQMQEHQQEEILNHLAEAYGLEEKDTGTLSDALMAVAREMVADSLEEYLDGLHRPVPIQNCIYRPTIQKISQSILMMIFMQSAMHQLPMCSGVWKPDAIIFREKMNCLDMRENFNHI